MKQQSAVAQDKSALNGAAQAPWPGSAGESGSDMLLPMPDGSLVRLPRMPLVAFEDP